MSSAASSLEAVTARVPAKVNLELMVGPPRPDGFHYLATVFQAVGLHDDVTVEPADDWGITINGPYAHLVPADETNLALRAARLLAEESGIDIPVHITIDKDIPVAAGMAGGSADAAGALLACDALWGLFSSKSALEQLAAELGSDVPFALLGGTAMGSGRGDRLAPVLGRGRYTWVFALSDVGLSTPTVYAECDRLRANLPVPEPTPSASLMTALRLGDAPSLGKALSNDLQPAALSLQPRLEEVLSTGLDNGALGGIVSGSGPTVAFLVSDTERSLDLAVALTASGAAPAMKRAVGPVRGAHIITAASGPRGSFGPNSHKAGPGGPAGLRSS
ncbi:MAG: 4-diphosphocytidyl-2-C-methyl-D-erythritol kinase [Actinomycetota bacterium]|jgi:4-diphosphocytidyl-2-C-methyl-D-erythritol kinase|nr:4-diphosphocytidyl-2-C-methyl-D-erythritol kinase [Actinomycetota bacterium]